MNAFAYILRLLLLLCVRIQPTSSSGIATHSDKINLRVKNTTISPTTHSWKDHHRSLQSGTWERITYDDFEANFGNFGTVSSTSDAKRSRASRYASQGSYSAMIRDNSGQKSSVFHVANHDVTQYSDLRVSFTFYARTLKKKEDFFLEYSSDGGDTWLVVKRYVVGRHFRSGRFTNSRVVFSRQSSFLLTRTGKIRFRCDAKNNRDRVYIDEVLFEGRLPPPLTREDICPLDRRNVPAKYEILPHTDSSTGDGVEDDLSEISSLAFSEQTDANGNRFAYAASDKEQFSLKVIQFTDNVFASNSNLHGLGNTVATYTLHLPDELPPTNDDWEDISLGPCTDSNANSAYTTDQVCIYIGNTGNTPRNNYLQRKVLKIFKFVEPTIVNGAPQNSSVDVATIEFEYGNGFSQDPDTYYDAEAMFVDWVGVSDTTNENNKGDIFIVTHSSCSGGVGKIPVAEHKNLLPATTSSVVYNMSAVVDDPPKQGNATCADSPFRTWVGADMRRDGRLIAILRGSGNAPAVYFFPRLADQSVAQALDDSPCDYIAATSFGLTNEKKHEAVAFVDPEGSRFADTSECDFGQSCNVPVYFYELEYADSDFIPIVEPISGWQEITFDDFEDRDLGSYVSGGGNANASNDFDGAGAYYACGGQWSAMINEDRGSNSSFFHSTDYACDSYSLLRVTFSFRFGGYDHLDSFFIEISFDGGSNYYIVDNWSLDVDSLENTVCYPGHVLLTPALFRRTTFGDEVRLRFRNSGNAGNDRAYVDDILFEGHTLEQSQSPTNAPTGTPPTYIPGDLTTLQAGLLLSDGLEARIVGKAGDRVVYRDGSKSTARFHGQPDAGATFPDTNENNPGGFIYVSNSELSSGQGGVGALTFDVEGNVLNFKQVLAGTSVNCGGGRTPWNTWMSCEETDSGLIYQVDPTGVRDPQVATLGNTGGRWESFSYDIRNRQQPYFFATEDYRKGTVRRFTPDTVDWVNDPWHMLHGAGVTDYLMIFPNSTNDGGTFRWTNNFRAAKRNAQKYYPQTEGIDVYGSQMFLVCKYIRQLFTINMDDGTYSNRTTLSGLFDGQPDTLQRILGDSRDLLYFTEDGGVDAGVHARDHLGRFYTILESPRYRSETTGLSFSPDGRFLIVAYQHNGLLFQVWRKDGFPFHAKHLDVKFHQA